MPKAIVTKDVIFTAATKLHNELKRTPTNREVHAELKNKGSMGTINKFMQQWSAEQTLISDMELPSSLLRELREFMDSRDISLRQQWKNEKDNYQNTIDDLVHELNESQNQLDASNATNEELSSLNIKNNSIIEKLNSDIDALRSELHQERIRNESLQRDNCIISIKIDELPALQNNLEDLKKSYDILVDERNSAKTKIAVLEERIKGISKT